MPIRWNEASTLQFIYYYKLHECLWNTKNEFYTNKTARDIALQQIVDHMPIPNFDVRAAKVKIKNLRAHYFNEWKKVCYASLIGEYYEPTTFWYKEMDSFMRDVAVGIPNLNQPPRTPALLREQPEVITGDSIFDSSSIYENVMDGSSRGTVSPALNKQKKYVPKPKSRQTQQLTPQTKAKPSSSGSAKRKRPFADSVDEFEVFGNSVSVQLKKLSVSRALKAQTKIQAILTEERINDIEANPSSNDGSNHLSLGSEEFSTSFSQQIHNSNSSNIDNIARFSNVACPGSHSNNNSVDPADDNGMIIKPEFEPECLLTTSPVSVGDQDCNAVPDATENGKESHSRNENGKESHSTNEKEDISDHKNHKGIVIKTEKEVTSSDRADRSIVDHANTELQSNKELINTPLPINGDDVVVKSEFGSMDIPSESEFESTPSFIEKDSILQNIKSENLDSFKIVTDMPSTANENITEKDIRDSESDLDRRLGNLSVKKNDDAGKPILEKDEPSTSEELSSKPASSSGDENKQEIETSESNSTKELPSMSPPNDFDKTKQEMETAESNSTEKLTSTPAINDGGKVCLNSTKELTNTLNLNDGQQEMEISELNSTKELHSTQALNDGDKIEQEIKSSESNSTKGMPSTPSANDVVDNDPKVESIPSSLCKESRISGDIDNDDSSSDISIIAESKVLNNSRDLIMKPECELITLDEDDPFAGIGDEMIV